MRRPIDGCARSATSRRAPPRPGRGPHGPAPTPLPTIPSGWSPSTSASTPPCRRSTPVGRRGARRLPRGACRAAGLPHRSHQRGDGARSPLAAPARRWPSFWMRQRARRIRRAAGQAGGRAREAGDSSAAAVSLERARAAGAQNPELANDLGVVYARLGRAAEARVLFQQLLGRDPDDATTWNNLGVLELSVRTPGASGRGLSSRRRRRSHARRRVARAWRSPRRAGSTGGDRRMAAGRTPAAARLRSAVQPGHGRWRRVRTRAKRSHTSSALSARRPAVVTAPSIARVEAMLRRVRQ